MYGDIFEGTNGKVLHGIILNGECAIDNRFRRCGMRTGNRAFCTDFGLYPVIGLWYCNEDHLP